MATPESNDELTEEVIEALLHQMKTAGHQGARNLAEAIAWLRAPAQPHGGTS